MAYPVRPFDHAVMTYVVDGDTCDISVDLGFNVTVKQRFRLTGVNTPERGQPGWQEAKDFLATCVGKELLLNVTKIDKYGRYLAEIICEGHNINDELIERGLAVPYGA